MSQPRYAQLSLEDLALPISSNGLRILAYLRIRCWSREGAKARELTYSDMAEATRLGRQAVGTAVRELIDVGLVEATPRPGGVWRYLVSTAPVVDRPGPVGRARRAPLGPKRSRPNPLSSPPESAEQPARIRSADHADPLSGSVTGDVTTDNRLVTTVDDRRRRADAIEAQIAARASRATGPTVLAHLEGERDRYLQELDGRAHQIVMSVSPHLGRREDRDSNGRRLADAWERDSALVLRAWRIVLEEVAAGRRLPEHAGGAFNGGAFGRTLAAAMDSDTTDTTTNTEAPEPPPAPWAD